MDRDNQRIIEVNRVRKSFGPVQAVRDVSFNLEPDTMFGLIGPDGAGKTTLLRMLCGLLVPDDGEMQVLGFDPVKNQDQIKSKLGYMPQRFSHYPDLNVLENLRFFADIYQVSKKHRLESIERLLEFSRLTPFANRKARDLSGGMKQKLALSCTLIHTPKLLILDEPTTGVDPVSRVEFWNILKELKSTGVTILLTTPYMDEATLCDQAALAYEGSILAQGTPEELISNFPHHLIRILTPKARQVAKLLIQENAFSGVELYGDRVHVAVRDIKGELDRIQQILITYNLPFSKIEAGKPNLEDVFVHLVKQVAPS